MSRNKLPGLHRRPGGGWVLDKVIPGIGRIQRRGPEGDVEAANRWAEDVIAEFRREHEQPKRGTVTFEVAAIRYLRDHEHKVTIRRDAQSLKLVHPYIGKLPIERVHAGTLERFVARRRKDGVKSGTVRRDLAVISRVLTLAARLWRHEDGSPWLLTAPLLPVPDWGDTREPYPLSDHEQRALFLELPPHLHRCALFMVHTGLRDGELRALRFDWLMDAPSLEGRRLFVLPASITKNRRERVVPLNSVTESIVRQCEDETDDLLRGHVFTYKGRPLGNAIGNTSWQAARKRAQLSQVRVHDLRHTFGRRLRALGVSDETRADLLGHDRGSITTHYSAAELGELFAAVDKLASRPKTGAILRAPR